MVSVLTCSSCAGVNVTISGDRSGIFVSLYSARFGRLLCTPNLLLQNVLSLAEHRTEFGFLCVEGFLTGPVNFTSGIPSRIHDANTSICRCWVHRRGYWRRLRLLNDQSRVEL